MLSAAYFDPNDYYINYICKQNDYYYHSVKVITLSHTCHTLYLQQKNVYKKTSTVDALWYHN